MWWPIAAGVAVLTVPLAVAAFERAWRRPGPRGPGFWALARAVGGRCHVRWGRGQSPVVRVALPGGAEGRVHTIAAGQAPQLEARAYLAATAGLTARLSQPAARPLRWRTPNLAPWPGWPSAEVGVEVTDPQRLEALTEDPSVRKALERAVAGAPSELLLAGRVVLLRRWGASGEAADAAAARLGPSLVQAVRDITTALADAPAADEPGPCVACAQGLDDDPWRCPGCRRPMHRGCRELLAGCGWVDCAETADAPPGPRQG